MLVLAFIFFVFVLTFVTGLLVQVFRPVPVQLHASEVLNAGILGLALMVLMLQVLVFIFPLKELLRPEVYFSFFGGGLAALFFLRPTVDRLFVIGVILSALLLGYVFSSEIARNSTVSFGGNGDFFNHQRMQTYLWSFSILDDVELPIGYAIAQEYVSWGRYPIGAHLLMSIFTAPFAQHVTDLVAMSWHKVFLGLTALCAVTSLPLRQKQKSVSLVLIFMFLTLPLLQSVVAMDFVSQLASFIFVTRFCFSVFEKKNSHALIFLAAVLITYYPAVLCLLPLILWWTGRMYKEKSYKAVAMLCLLTTVGIWYFLPNIKGFETEINGLGGLVKQFAVSEVISVLPIRYGPYSWGIESLPTVFTTPLLGIVVRLLLVGGVVAAIVVYTARSARVFPTSVYFITSQIVLYMVAYMFVQPYITYKVFSIGIVANIPIVMMLIRGIEWKSHARLYSWLMFFSICCVVINLDQGYYYHNNSLRDHYQSLPYTSQFLQAVTYLEQEAILLHRDIGFTSLLSLRALDKELFTQAFYFNNYASAMLPGADQTKLCDFTQYDTSKVSQVLLEEGSCDGVMPSAFLSSHHTDNGDLKQILLLSP